jgi:hypothetical protein
MFMRNQLAMFGWQLAVSSGRRVDHLCTAMSSAPSGLQPRPANTGF